MATEFISNSWLMPTNANAEANRVSNYSLDFDGSNDEIDCGSISQTNEGDISFSAWCNVTASGTYQAILSSTYTSSKAGINIVIRNDGKIKFERNQDTSNTRNNTGYAVAGFSFGSWHHLCGTFNSTSGELKAYINGVLQATSSDTSAGASTTNSLHIGRLSDSSNYPANGKIAETVIYDYTLSASQVTELYGTGSAIGNPMAITNGRKPVAYYPLGNAAFNGEFLTPNGAEQDYVFDFDGVNDYILTGSAIDLGTSCSISFWYSGATSGRNGSVVGGRSFAEGGVSSNYQAIFLSSGTYLAFYQSNSSTPKTFIYGSSPMNSSDWFHAVIVRDGANLNLYLNGADTSTSYTDLDATAPTYVRNIATNGENQTGSQTITGKISNVSVFNTALPATGTESVASLYNYGTPPNIASYSNLQAWWELDASATFDGNWSIPDASGNSNTGTSSGMTAANLILSDLIINQSYDPFSLSFDGSDDNVNCGDFSAYDNGDLSCSIWIFRTTSVSNDYIISNTNSSNVAGLDIIIDSTERLMLRRNTRTKDCKSGWTTSGITLNNWHHIAITYNEASNEGKIYVDKVLKSTIAGSLSTNSASTDLKLGSASIDLAFFTGKLSNCSIYNSTLSEAQVTTLYNEHKPFDLNTFEVTPVSWWRLGSVNSSYNSTSSEWTILDEIGTNNGTGSNLGPAQTALSDGVGATGSGLSSGMSSGTNRTGDAPYSSSNAVSYNMSVTAKSTSVPT